jgi:hypothetical protein
MIVTSTDPGTEKSSNAQPHLYRVDPRIRRGQACIGDVQIAQFQAPVVLRAEDVRAQGSGGSEVHGVGAERDVVVGEQRAAAEFEVGREAAAADEIPLQTERVESHAVGGVGGLENEKHGNRIDGVLEASAQKAGEMRAGDDPPVTQAGIEDAGIPASAADGVSAARPDLDFVTVFLGAGLRQRDRGEGADGESEQKRAHDWKTHDTGRDGGEQYDRGPRSGAGCHGIQKTPAGKAAS